MIDITDRFDNNSKICFSPRDIFSADLQDLRVVLTNGRYPYSEFTSIYKIEHPLTSHEFRVGLELVFLIEDALDCKINDADLARKIANRIYPGYVCAKSKLRENYYMQLVLNAVHSGKRKIPSEYIGNEINCICKEFGVKPSGCKLFGIWFYNLLTTNNILEGKVLSRSSNL